MQASHEDGMRKVAEMIKGIRTAMLVTNSEHGVPRSRPMSTQDVDFDGALWFFTGVDTRKVREIARNPTVAVTYASSGKETYVSLTGQAALVDDRALIREYWSPFLKAWFDGPDDPSLRLLRVDVAEAEYWDTPGGKIASLYQIAKAVITGDTRDMEEDHGSVSVGRGKAG